MCKDLCFVAVENGKIVGVSLNIIVPECTKEIIEAKMLLVHPEYRRQRIGSKLLRRVCIKADNKYDILQMTHIQEIVNFVKLAVNKYNDFVLFRVLKSRMFGKRS